jgi:hypothetical protein
MVAAFVIAAALASPAFLPPDDPDFTRCLDASHGIRLEWQKPEDGSARTYLLVKRLDTDGQWHPWLKTQRAEPPFILVMQGALAQHGRFAWMLFDVDGNRRSEGPWHYFCTAPSDTNDAPGRGPD